MREHELDPLAILGPEQQCFGCGPRNAHGMRLTFRREGDEVVTRFEARPGWEGPPGVVHGGLQATLADEIGAWTVIGICGRFGFTSSMNVRYVRPARMDAPIEARGRVTSATDSVAMVQVILLQGGKRVLSGRISYALPTADAAERMLGAPLPDSWRRLARSSGGE